jgi:pimeloyl-ACP methyl ester carboxylesterase
VNRNKEPDPLFIFAGGPGQAATETYVSLRSAFNEINRSRDIVLIDQRGTGKSNALRCESPDDFDLIQNLTPDELEAYQLEQMQTCLSSLPADPRYYTTTLAVNDFDAVREALGYETINLYGLSYGTRVALTYLKLYPNHVRAVILDGVLPQDAILGVDVAHDAQQALDLIFSRCAADTDCQAAFPNVQSEFDALIQELEAAPVEVTLPHPTTGEQVTVTLDSATVAQTVRLLSYTAETVALIPLFIHAASEGNYVPITAQSLVTSNDLAESISGGLNASVLCAEDAPFITPEAAAEANADTYLGDLQTEQLDILCGIWPYGSITDDFKAPVTSDVPVLLLSGEADPVTPSTNGDKAAQTLSNSLHLIAPGQGHNVIFRGCIPNIAADFIENGSVQGLEIDCVNKIAPMPFFVDFTGTRP